MGPYCSLLVNVSFRGSLWFLIGPYASLQVLMDSYRSLSVHMDSYRSLCVHMDSNVSLWILMRLMGPFVFFYVFLRHYGF